MINDIVDKYGCKATYAYLVDVTVCGRTREELDQNLSSFLKAAKDCNLTFNNDKCKFTKNSLTLLGFNIQDGVLKPDPERVKPTSRREGKLRVTTIYPHPLAYNLPQPPCVRS